VKLAARGQRDMDAGPVPITDAEDLGQVRRQARRVRVQALLLAAAVTGAIIWI
jgi:hypothetical protein